jgi:hypothetical protein
MVLWRGRRLAGIVTYTALHEVSGGWRVYARYRGGRAVVVWLPSRELAERQLAAADGMRVPWWLRD